MKLKKSIMKVFGCFALLLGAIVITPASSFIAQQPKCPDEFLK